MNIVALCGVAIISVILCVMLKRYHAEYAVIISLAAGVLMLAVIFSQVVPAVSQIRRLLSATKLSSEYAAVLLKSLGICFLTQFASDSCRDAGESALSSKIELAGKIAILGLSLPLFEKITETALSLIGG